MSDSLERVQTVGGRLERVGRMIGMQIDLGRYFNDPLTRLLVDALDKPQEATA